MQRVQSPEGLLHELESLPRGTVYEDPHEWVFRGVGCNKYSLLPTALRHGTYLSLGGELRPVRRWSTREAMLAEAYMLQMYLQALLRTGLTVPGGHEACRTTLQRVLRESLPPIDPPGAEGMSHEVVRWPEEELLPLLALAQHHGLPTRLLDFSWDARVAAYFAATDAQHGSSEFLSVWALNASRLDGDVQARTRIRERGASTGDPGARLVYVDSSLNPRLRAQRGLFLFATEYRQPIPRSVNHATPRPLEDLKIPALENGNLRRFDIHRRHARELLAHLARVGVDGGAVFPDHAGAWTSVQERLRLGQRSRRRYEAQEQRLLRLWDTHQ